MIHKSLKTSNANQYIRPPIQETPEKPLNNKINQKQKKVISPIEKLNKRLTKDFIRKKYIGDILIDENEYVLLIEYFKQKYKNLINLYSHNMVDIAFSVALVQIGIKHYDGKYWPHVKEVLGVDSLPVNHQKLIGDSFISTLKHYQKLFLREDEKVNTILMHGFISDYYANNFFDFLFEYYRIDLERDITRNRPENMQILIEAMIKNDNRQRTYLMVQHTADAISKNPRGSKIRIRRFLKLIDKCFWEQEDEISGKNRLTKLFNNWLKESKSFNSDVNLYHGASNSEYGRKSFFSPYLKWNAKISKFYLMLPSQLFKQQNEGIELSWRINIGDETIIRQADYYTAITGYKTEEDKIELKNENLFMTISCQLMSSDNKIRSFKKISSDCVRFFDNDGDYREPDSLPTGTVYAFTKKDDHLYSPAFIESEVYGNFILSYFEFQTGDIVRLPDAMVVSIGKRIEEGLSQRGILKGAYASVEDTHVPIYFKPPNALIKIRPSRVNGTMIKINGKPYRMFDKETIELQLNDRSDDIGYLINLADFGCTKNGVYSIYIDVPNDRTNRYWTFFLLNGINFRFEDAPYIFKSRGTITFCENILLAPKSKSKVNKEKVNKEKGKNSYNFEIIPNETHLCFTYQLHNHDIDMFFEIPALYWRFGEDDWEIEKPSEIWHSKFPIKILFKYPDAAIELSLKEELDSEEAQSVIYRKGKETGVFDCDVTRFKSWFNRDLTTCTVYLKLSGKKIPFIDVVTKSVLVSGMITGDYDKNILKGDFRIIGQAEYYADIIVSGEKLYEKIPVIDEKFSVPMPIKSGDFKVSIYEAEDDMSGFGDSVYCLIGDCFCHLINPNNLEGETLKISHLMKGNEYQFKLQLARNYYIIDLSLPEAGNKHNYTGKMVVEENKQVIATFPVCINFMDLNNLNIAQIAYIDDGESVLFLYDSHQKTLIKFENMNLPYSVRYRRYADIYPEGYAYAIEFGNNFTMSKYVNSNEPYEYSGIQAPKQDIRGTITENVVWKESRIKDDEIRIDDMNLSVRTYNCLKKAGLFTVNDIKRAGTPGLLKVRNLGRSSFAEIIRKMSTYGILIETYDQVAITREEENFKNEQQKPNTTLGVHVNSPTVAKPNIQLQEDILDKLISETNLSPTVYNCLKNAGYTDLRSLYDLILAKGIKGLSTIKKLDNVKKQQVITMLQEYRVI